MDQSRNRAIFKKLIKIIGIPIFILFILTTLATYDFNNHTVFSCPYSYTELPIPENLEGSDIIFEKTAYGGEFAVGDLGYDCLSIFSDLNQGINKIWVEATDSTPKTIAEGKSFTVYKRVYIECNSFACMDSGGGGDLLLVKDDQGKIWNIDPFHFDVNEWGKSSGRFLFKAGYYRNGKRLGDVTLKRVFPENRENIEWLN
jgi:hypothetical protein